VVVGLRVIFFLFPTWGRMTDMFVISRGPDTRPPEVKAAADKIVIGYHVVGPMCSFFCTECKQSGPIEPKHMEDCYVGKILAAWMARLRT